MRERLGWLDGLRAVAVLLVVYAHLSRCLLRGAREVSSEWLHAGTAGVMLFFLVSGYIIPASLERHGSLRAFWVSRIGRLFPLYLVVGGVVVALGAAGVVPVDPYLADHPATGALAHLTMLPHLLGVPLVTPVFWTLSFETAFYLLVSALFALRVPRAGALVAVGLAVVAVVTAPLAPAVLGTPVPATALVLVCGLLALTSGRRRLVVGGGVALAGLAGTLLVLNQDGAHVWDGLLIVAVMFVGTTVYRAEHGQLRWWQAGMVAGVVGAALLATWFAELRSLDALTPQYMARSVITLTAFGGAFAVGMLTRRWRTPRPLAWLGLVSYSVYLVHYVLIQVLRPVLNQRLPEFPAVLVFVVALFGLSWATHRFIEVPGQRWSRTSLPTRSTG